jgi:hypothetical protein
VEVAKTADEVLVRDSKLADSAVLRFDRSTWAAFVAAAVSDEIRAV